MDEAQGAIAVAGVSQAFLCHTAATFGWPLMPVVGPCLPLVAALAWMA